MNSQDLHERSKQGTDVMVFSNGSRDRKDSTVSVIGSTSIAENYTSEISNEE